MRWKIKNKRLLIILVIFLAVGTLAILGSVVFSISKIEVNFNNALDYFVTDSMPENQAADKLGADIKASLSSMLGKNIFFNVNSKTIADKIESHQGDDYDGYHLRVTNVMARFPNTLVITIRERYAVYSYKSGSATVVLDGDLKIIDTKIPNDKETGAPRSLIDLSNAFSVNDTEAIVPGKYLTDKDSPEKAAIIKKIVPFFWSEDSYEDAITKYFTKFEFGNTSGEDSSQTFTTLKMTSLPLSGTSVTNNYFELDIVDANVETNAKLAKIWALVENQKSNEFAGAGRYEVLKWLDGLRAEYTPWKEQS